MSIVRGSDAPASDASRMRHFHALSHDEQVAAIRRLSEDGQSAHGIARATGVSVEQIRALLTQEAAT